MENDSCLWQPERVQPTSYLSPFDQVYALVGGDKRRYVSLLASYQEVSNISLLQNIESILMPEASPNAIAKGIFVVSRTLARAFDVETDPTFSPETKSTYYNASRWFCLNAYPHLGDVENLADLVSAFLNACASGIDSAEWSRILHDPDINQKYDDVSLDAYLPDPIHRKLDELGALFGGRKACLISCANGGTPVGIDLFLRLQSRLAPGSLWLPIRYSKVKSQDQDIVLPAYSGMHLEAAAKKCELAVILDEDSSMGNTLHEATLLMGYRIKIPIYPTAIKMTTSAINNTEVLRQRALSLL